MRLWGNLHAKEGGKVGWGLGTNKTEDKTESEMTSRGYPFTISFCFMQNEDNHEIICSVKINLFVASKLIILFYFILF